MDMPCDDVGPDVIGQESKCSFADDPCLLKTPKSQECMEFSAPQPLSILKAPSTGARGGIGYGIATPNELSARGIVRLVSLALVDRQGGRLLLTDLGRQRLAGIPHGAQRVAMAPNDAFTATYAPALRRTYIRCGVTTHCG